MSSPNFRLSGGSLGYWTACNNLNATVRSPTVRYYLPNCVLNILSQCYCIRHRNRCCNTTVMMLRSRFFRKLQRIHICRPISMRSDILGHIRRSHLPLLGCVAAVIKHYFPVSLVHCPDVLVTGRSLVFPLCVWCELYIPISTESK